MDLVSLHCLHRHTSPSITSCLLPSTMGTAHLTQLEDEESSPFLLNQLTRSSEGQKLTGPNSNRDITSYAVLPAFVMHARLMSHPHYVRLCIVAIHCNFSSESYIHIDPKSLTDLEHMLHLKKTVLLFTSLWIFLFTFFNGQANKNMNGQKFTVRVRERSVSPRGSIFKCHAKSRKFGLQSRFYTPPPRLTTNANRHMLRLNSVLYMAAP